MKKLLLTSIIAISFAMPAFADIAANANSATCNSGTLNTASGSSNLTAIWTPNTINITWDNNNATSGGTGGASTCTYSSPFNIPTTPSRTGYTFGGWALKAAAAQCSLSGLSGNTDGVVMVGKVDSSHCFYYNETTNYFVDVEEDGGCSDPVMQDFPDLTTGDWIVHFDYGVIRGRGKCSAQSDESYESGEISETNGGHCWCYATQYTPKNGDSYSVLRNSYTYGGDLDNYVDCEAVCNTACANGVMVTDVFRQELFNNQ